MSEQARVAVLGWQQTVNAAWERQQAGLLGAAAPAVEPSGVTRQLTADEIAIAHSVFGDSLNTDFVSLSEGGILGSGGYARTIPYTITFPPGFLTNPPKDFNDLLVHELTHIWQYQHGHSVEELLGSALVGDYDYGKEQGLRDAFAQGKTFQQFNSEEQGDILRDYYIATRTGQDTSAYDPYVRDVRDEGPPVPPWPPIPAGF